MSAGQRLQSYETAGREKIEDTVIALLLPITEFVLSLNLKFPPDCPHSTLRLHNSEHRFKSLPVLIRVVR